MSEEAEESAEAAPEEDAPRRKKPRKTNLLPALALTAVFAFLTFRAVSPPTNVLEQTFQERLASRVEDGKVAFVLAGDPKT